MNLDILVFASHPDDAELACSGTIARHVAAGKKVGVCDLTHGELGTRGTPELRAEEAKRSSEILGLKVRENLGLRDGYFRNDPESQIVLIKAIRKYRPHIVLGNAITDRHPDHGRASNLIRDAVFMAGLAKIHTEEDDQPQKSYRPQHLFHYIQNDYIEPDFIVDISNFWDKKIASIKAFKSQFFDPGSSEPNTFISSPRFLDFIEARAKAFGHRIGADYGEGFTSNRSIGIDDLFHIK
jgi:bacillithiol biosynthesis deacetylase BshB1